MKAQPPGADAYLIAVLQGVRYSRREAGIAQKNAIRRMQVFDDKAVTLPVNTGMTAADTLIKERDRVVRMAAEEHLVVQGNGWIAPEPESFKNFQMCHNAYSKRARSPPVQWGNTNRPEETGSPSNMLDGSSWGLADDNPSLIGRCLPIV